jgi:protein phosphatase
VIGPNEIEYASHTDVGIKRSHNQDSHAAMPAPDEEQWRQVGHVFLVADGMGAHAVGELASKMATDNIPHLFSKYVQGNPVIGLRRAIAETNATIYTRGKQNREFEGMGTTGTTLVLRPEGAWVGHVGDSRAYRIRGNVIEQLSFDHSLLWELAKRQNKSPDELTGIPSNVIVRSLGPEANVQVDVEGPHPLERGDTFLLCSDGLSGQVNDRVLGAVVGALPPSEAVQFLVHLANLQGGPDNITVIVARIGGDPPPSMHDSQVEVVFPTSELKEPVVPRYALFMYYLSRVPWAFLQLAVGVILAAIAIALAFVDPGGAAMIVFIFAGLALLGGIVTLMIQNLRQSRMAAVEEPEERPLQVYRQTPCPHDAPLCERLIESTKLLEEEVRQKQWEYDAKKYQEHLKHAAVAFRLQRYRDAFREQCRAMTVLMQAVHAYRAKNEDFKPVWDRPRS